VGGKKRKNPVEVRRLSRGITFCRRVCKAWGQEKGNAG